jgi:hypothetical protein
MFLTYLFLIHYISNSLAAIKKKTFRISLNISIINCNIHGFEDSKLVVVM